MSPFFVCQEDISARMRSLPENRGYTMFNFYQNQETIRGQALVRQYRVQVCFARSLHSYDSHGVAHAQVLRRHPWGDDRGFQWILKPRCSSLEE